MPALNYQSWKAHKVESGECRQTIRQDRHRPFRVGDQLYHYVGMRTKACRKIRESVCAEVQPILIDGVFVLLSEKCLKEAERDALARADGFSDYLDMEAWFNKTYSMPFSGQVIRW